MMSWQDYEVVGNRPEWCRRLDEPCPDGVDVYFDNLGGDMLETAMNHMAQEGRIANCGAISAYNQGKQPLKVRDLE